MAVLARPLLVLRDRYLNVKWPKRPRRMDGWIGDASHQARRSDHNENKRGRVNALDVDSTQPPDPATPIHVPTVIAAMIMHPSTHYIIHRGRIMDRDDNFMPHKYTGPNPHGKHIHCSIIQSAAAEISTATYRFIFTPLRWALLRNGSKSRSVRELQAYLVGWGYAVAVDGVFGANTEKAVRAFQGHMNLTVDGKVGPATRAKLRPIP